MHGIDFHHHVRSGESLQGPSDICVAGVAAVCMANELWRTGRMIGWDAENKRMAPADTLELSHRPVGKTQLVDF